MKKKVENMESKCVDIDFLMNQTSHLLSDYEGFNNDMEEVNERLENMDEIIKMHGETINIYILEKINYKYTFSRNYYTLFKNF